MNPRAPSFQKHKTGVYFTHWGGKNHYFSVDREESYRQYLQSLQAWSEWRAQRNTQRFPPLRKARLVVDVAEKFLEFKGLEGGAARRRHYANHLRRFLHGFGHRQASTIKATDLHALKEEMLRAGYSPKTINHDLSTVKSLFLWASGVDLIPPVNLRYVRSLALPPTPDKSLTLTQVREMLEAEPVKLKPWLAVNYLALMRPSEVVTVVNGRGEWEEPWLFRCHGKVTNRTQEYRRIVFSDEALFWLSKCEPHWSRQDSYYRATERAGLTGGPHPLRHSAATHLAQLGVARHDIDLLLGHLPPRVSRTYVRIDWQSLRAQVARLTLRSDDR